MKPARDAVVQVEPKMGASAPSAVFISLLPP
jgi:hypothetical protein